MTSSRLSACKKALRCGGKVLGGLLSAVIILLLVVCFIVDLPLTPKLISKKVSEGIDASLTVGKTRLSFIRNFPNASLRIEDVNVVTQEGDTLAAFDELLVRAAWMKCLFGRIDVPEVSLEGLRADARCYEDGSANWNIFPVDAAAVDNAPDSSELVLPRIKIGKVSIGMPRIAFSSPNYNLAFSLFASLSAENTDTTGLHVGLQEFRLFSDGIEADIIASADSLLSSDPHFSTELTLKLKLDDLSEYIPEQFKVGGHVVMDVNLDALLSQLCLERFPGVTLDASLVADHLNLLSPEDSLAVHLGEPKIVLRSPKDEPLFADISFDKILARSGDERVMARDIVLKAVAGGDPSKMRRRRAEAQPRPPRDSVRREVPDFLSEKDFRLSDIHVDLNKSISDLLLRLRPAGGVDIKEAYVATPLLPLRNRVSDVHLRFDTDGMLVKSLKVNSGTSNLSVNGSLDGLGSVLGGMGALKLNLDVNSSALNVNELLSAVTAPQTASVAVHDSLVVEDFEKDIINAEPKVSEYASVDSVASPTGLFVVPANLIADIRLNARNVDYAAVDIKRIGVDIKMRERCLQIANFDAQSDICNIGLNAFYSTRTKNDIKAGFNLGLHEISADKVIELIPSVDDVLPMIKSFSGKLDCELAATTQLDTNMNFLLPTMEGMFKISGQDLVLQDLGSFKKVARILLFRDKKHGNIHDMNVNGIITGGQVKVYPFLLGIDRYDVALKGTQDFEGAFKYHVSLVKSPLPFKIGVNLYGDDFSDMHWRLGRARYRSTKLPSLYEEVDDMQVNLATSIRNIFKRGVDAVLSDNRRRLGDVDSKQEASEESGEMEDLSSQEEEMLEMLTLEADVDELTSDILSEFLQQNS